jgi:hypothetical protein
MARVDSRKHSRFPEKTVIRAIVSLLNSRDIITVKHPPGHSTVYVLPADPLKRVTMAGTFDPKLQSTTLCQGIVVFQGKVSSTYNLPQATVSEQSIFTDPCTSVRNDGKYIGRLGISSTYTP